MCCLVNGYKEEVMVDRRVYRCGVRAVLEVDVGKKL